MSAPDQFLATRWTLIVAAKSRHDPGGSEAFARLCERYYGPLYAYLRRRGHSVEDAQDLTQGFIARLMEKDVLRHADPARGRFRAFLLTALKHYAANEHVRATADKRGGAEAALPMDLETVEGRYRDHLQDSRTPERLYDRQWALSVLEGALATLRIECQSNGRGALLDAAHATLTGDHDRAVYKAIAERFAMSESGARVAVHRLRVRYRDLVRAAIAQTVDSEKAVDDELRYLRAALDG